MDLNWKTQEYLDSVIKQKCIKNATVEDYS